MEKILSLKEKNIEWINIERKGDSEISYLKEKFDFQDQDLEQCLRETRKSNITIRKDYIFFEILFPYYNKKTQLINKAEINFFIKKNKLITIHNNELFSLKDFYNSLEIDEVTRKNLLNSNVTILLCSILDYLFDACYPILDHISDDIINLERDIFIDSDSNVNSAKVLRIKWNIINFRRIMQVHKNIIQAIIESDSEIFHTTKLKKYYDKLIDKTKDIWSNLENDKDSISALQQTNESNMSFRLNNTMKFLTVISAVIMPATFITGLFGVNAKIPYIEHPIFFWGILFGCVVAILTSIIYFRRKKWF